MLERTFIRRFGARLRHEGLPWLFTSVRNRLWPAKPALSPAIIAATRDRVGLEIGGPSRIFSPNELLPVYSQALRIDNVNFTAETAWESALRDGGEFRFHQAKSPGRQFLREAGDLADIADASYDFILSSHCLEHLANPFGALLEWRRLVRPGGHLILILPDPTKTFDHRRPITLIEHLRADAAAHTSEADLTHLDEILSLHDLNRDPLAGSAEKFRNRSLRNAENRCLHHHVFDCELMRATLEETGWASIEIEGVRPIHLIALARKPCDNAVLSK